MLEPKRKNDDKRLFTVKYDNGGLGLKNVKCFRRVAAKRIIGRLQITIR